MSLIDLNQSFRRYAFIALGFLMPYSTASISILLILLSIAVLVDKSSYQRLYKNLKTGYFQSFFLFFLLHIVGFLWLNVESINWHKSWMIWIIPILAVAVDHETARKGVFAFLISMLFAEIYVYYNIFSTWEDYLRGAYFSEMLPMSHVNYNPFLAISIGFLLTILLSRRNSNWKITLIGVLVLLTMVINMFLTGGRAGQISFVYVWIAISFFFIKENKKLLIAMIMSLILILITAWNTSPVFKNRVSDGIDRIILYQKSIDSKSTQEDLYNPVGLRLHWYEHSIKLFTNSPIYGHGTGSFENKFKNYADQSEGLILNTSNPHSYHILILFQFGLIGLIIYLNIFIQQIRTAYSLPKDYEFRAMAFIFPLFFILINFFDSYLWSHQTQAIFAYLSTILYRPDLYVKPQ